MNSYQFSQAYPGSVSGVSGRHLHSYFLRFYRNKQELGTACGGLSYLHLHCPSVASKCASKAERDQELMLETSYCTD